LVVNLREEARRLVRQTVNEARTPAVVTLLFECDQPVAFEKAQVPPHTDLRHFQLPGQALDAHRAVGFEQINNRAASLFEDIFYGGYSHEPIIEGAVGFCHLFVFQPPEARAPLGRISIVYGKNNHGGRGARHGDKSAKAPITASRVELRIAWLMPLSVSNKRHWPAQEGEIGWARFTTARALSLRGIC